MRMKRIEVQNNYRGKKSANTIPSPETMEELISVIGEDSLFSYAKIFWEVQVRADIRGWIDDGKTSEEIQSILDKRYKE